jgi:hypothetical protein
MQVEVLSTHDSEDQTDRGSIARAPGGVPSHSHSPKAFLLRRPGLPYDFEPYRIIYAIRASGDAFWEEI